MLNERLEPRIRYIIVQLLGNSQTQSTKLIVDLKMCLSRSKTDFEEWSDRAKWKGPSPSERL
jgi:hypothetical protein